MVDFSFGRGLFVPCVPVRADFAIRFEGVDYPAQQGETVLAALLRQRENLGASEFDGSPRGGFCLMGACQDCSVWTRGGTRLRACMTLAQEGQDLVGRSPLGDLFASRAAS